MENKSISEIIQDLIDSDRINLPVQPELSEEISSYLTEEEVKYEQLWALVSQDPALLCILFRSANSSLYVGLPKTLTIQEAVTRLGTEKSIQIIQRVCRDSETCPQAALTPKFMPALWQHAQSCADGAKWLAERCGYQGLGEQAYLAGLLHDIGKQFLLSALEEIASCGENNLPISEQLALEVIDTMHVEQGLRLFKEWNLPEIYRDVVAEHHEEGLDSQNIVVALVKLANKGCRKVGLGFEHNPEIVLPTSGEAQFLGINEITLAEFEIMLEDKYLGGQPKPFKPEGTNTSQDVLS